MYENMNLKFDSGLGQYHRIRNILPQDKLNDEEQKFEKNFGKNMDFHPFIRFLHDAKNDYDEGSKLRTNKITKNMAKLIVLGLDIELLQNEHVVGINEKIQELITSGYQKADKIIYEIRIASYLVKKGQKVEFLKESISPTPDLLINDNVQLDCKKKDPTTKKDDLNYEYFQKIWDEVVKKLTLDKKYFFIFVHFKRTDQIEDSLADKAKNEVIEKINEGNSGKFEFSDFDVYLYLICKDKSDIIVTDFPFIPKDQILKVGMNPLFDRIDIVLRKRIGEEEYLEILRRGESFFQYRSGLSNINGKSCVQEFHGFSSSTKKLPDRFTSIIDAIKIANRQIDDSFPGIVSIGISELMEGMFPRDFQQAGVWAEDELKSNPKISAVLFTTEEFNEDTNEYSFGEHMIKNNSSNLKLPEQFDSIFTL